MHFTSIAWILNDQIISSYLICHPNVCWNEKLWSSSLHSFLQLSPASSPRSKYFQHPVLMQPQSMFLLNVGKQVYTNIKQELELIKSSVTDDMSHVHKNLSTSLFQNNIYHSSIDEDWFHALITTMYHWIKNFFTNEIHSMIPTKTKHRLRGTTVNCCESWSLQLRYICFQINYKNENMKSLKNMKQEYSKRQKHICVYITYQIISHECLRLWDWKINMWNKTKILLQSDFENQKCTCL